MNDYQTVLEFFGFGKKIELSTHVRHQMIFKMATYDL